jgi:hypothetical protein
METSNIADNKLGSKFALTHIAKRLAGLLDCILTNGAADIEVAAGTCRFLIPVSCACAARWTMLFARNLFWHQSAQKNSVQVRQSAADAH